MEEFIRLINEIDESMEAQLKNSLLITTFKQIRLGDTSSSTLEKFKAYLFNYLIQDFYFLNAYKGCLIYILMATDDCYLKEALMNMLGINEGEISNPEKLLKEYELKKFEIMIKNMGIHSPYHVFLEKNCPSQCIQNYINFIKQNSLRGDIYFLSVMLACLRTYKIYYDFFRDAGPGIRDQVQERAISKKNGDGYFLIKFIRLITNANEKGQSIPDLDDEVKRLLFNILKRNNNNTKVLEEIIDVYSQTCQFEIEFTNALTLM